MTVRFREDDLFSLKVLQREKAILPSIGGY